MANLPSLTFISFLFIFTNLPLFQCGLLDSYYYEQDQTMSVTVTDLNSIRIQIPYSFNFLNLCTPSTPITQTKTLSDIILGTEYTLTPYTININQDEKCKFICQKDFNYLDVDKFQWLIERNYFINFALDHLSAGMNYTIPTRNHSSVTYRIGIPLGHSRKNETTFIYNHYNMYIDLNEKDGKYQIVGFNIQPLSIKQNFTNECGSFKEEDYYDINNRQPLTQGNISFTYNVYFRQSNITFTSRWDKYFLSGRHREMHWIGLINANILILVVSCLVVYILSRAIKKDIDIYNQKVIADEIIDEYGWKQVCNDVFRRPKNLMLLCAFIGTGVEFFFIFVNFTISSLLGFMSPEKRSIMLNILVFLFCIMGLFAGFVSAYIYKLNSGRNWIKCSLLTTIIFPSMFMLTLFITRIMFSFEKSTEGFKISEFFILTIVWLCISFPLTMIGSLFGYRQKAIKMPCKVNAVPTKIGNKPWYLKLKYITWFTGLIPFATIFIEFIYIMSAMWRHQVYFVASFLGFSLMSLLITSMEISIIFIYLNLCKGDYNWMWKSFFVSASPALYIAGYSVYYFFYLNITRFTASVAYFCLMGLVSCVIGLVCGAGGVCMTYCFLYFIYSKIKID